MDKIAKTLNSLLDGIAGHISEHGDCNRYWDPKAVDGAVKTLREIDPKASALEYF